MYTHIYISSKKKPIDYYAISLFRLLLSRYSYFVHTVLFPIKGRYIYCDAIRLMLNIDKRLSTLGVAINHVSRKTFIRLPRSMLEIIKSRLKILQIEEMCLGEKGERERERSNLYFQKTTNMTWSRKELKNFFEDRFSNRCRRFLAYISEVNKLTRVWNASIRHEISRLIFHQQRTIEIRKRCSRRGEPLKIAWGDGAGRTGKV